MTTPCEASGDIHEIRMEQVKQGIAIAVTKEVTDQLRVEQVAFLSESREVISILRESAVEARSLNKQSKEAQDILFQKYRENRADIRTNSEKINNLTFTMKRDIEKEIFPIRESVKILTDHHLKEQGKGIFLGNIRYTIPVIGTIISVAILLWEKLKG